MSDMSDLSPHGRVFYDLASGRTMMLVEEPGYTFDGWLCYKHPDGQWVSLRKATEDDRSRIKAADAGRDVVVVAGEDRYRVTALSQKPLREVSLMSAAATADRIAELRAIGEEIKAIRAKQSPDAPFAGAAFTLASMVGELEAILVSRETGEAK